MEKIFYTYDELKMLVNKKGINSKSDYVKSYKNITSAEGINAPSDPRGFYSKNGWINWSVFLGKKLHAKKINNVYYSYDECRDKIKKYNIKSKSDFLYRIKNIINEDMRIPYNPYKTYESNWKGWGHFLSTFRIQDNLKNYKSFEDAKKWARSLNLKMYKEWRMMDISKLPPDIPKKPEKTYKNSGWVDYYDWLGIDKRSKMSFGENKICNILNDMKINFVFNKSLLDCKKDCKLRFDFYLPSKNVCIEFDGIQHFEAIDFFGGVEEFEKLKIRDSIKNNFCSLNNIKLIRIPYTIKDDEMKMLILEGVGPLQN